MLVDGKISFGNDVLFCLLWNVVSHGQHHAFLSELWHSLEGTQDAQEYDLGFHHLLEMEYMMCVEVSLKYRWMNE